GKTITYTSMLLCGLLLIYCQMTPVGQDGNSLFLTGAQDIYVAEVMIEGNATMDVSGFVAEMIMPVTDTASIVEAEIIAVATYRKFPLISIIFLNKITSFFFFLKFQIIAMFFALKYISCVLAHNSGQNFVVTLNATFRSFKVQDIITKIRTTYTYITDMNVTSEGLVAMEIPIGRVCYYSQYILNCSTDETMETCTWRISYPGQYPQTIGVGTEVIHLPCSNQTAISLLNIRANWAGTYTCLLTNGSVSHTATGLLEVAPLPEKVNVTSVPQTADCSVGTSTSVTVSCSIFPSPENYTVTINDLPAQRSVTSQLVNYTISLPIDCTTVTIPSVTAFCQIKNSLSQIVVMNTTIQIIYPGEPFCLEENGWPKTKGGEKATTLCTEIGRVGNMERMCNGTVWAVPVDLCIKESLNILLSISSDFEKGIGATTEGAIAIFDGLKNSTSTGNSYGDVMATVSVLTTMSSASTRVSLTDSLLPTPINLPFLDQITYIGLGISICSLIVFLIIEFLVWNAVVKSNLSHFRHMSLVNIALCLLIADCAFIASSFPNILNDTLCLILTLAKHFFFLGMFFWMLCLSMMLLHQLIFVFNPLRKSVYMPLAIIVGYVFPTMVVGVTYLYYNKRKDVTYYNRASCWLTYASSMRGSLYAFLLPIGFIVFANLCSMVVVLSTLLKPAATENTQKDQKEAAKSVVKVIVFLTPVFGGTWVLGLFVFLMEDNTITKVIINYAFTIVNSLQGLFILLTGCFGEKRVWFFLSSY
ncbi:hypothetical protein QTP86_031308, partial [Hemibagrus guttatus]